MTRILGTDVTVTKIKPAENKPCFIESELAQQPRVTQLRSRQSPAPLRGQGKDKDKDKERIVTETPG